MTVTGPGWAALEPQWREARAHGIRFSLGGRSSSQVGSRNEWINLGMEFYREAAEEEHGDQRDGSR